MNFAKASALLTITVLCTDDIFVQIGLLKTKPANNAAGSGLPTFRCLEDYAAYYVVMPGHDGKENTSVVLAAVHYDAKCIKQTHPIRQHRAY